MLLRKIINSSSLWELVPSLGLLTLAHASFLCLRLTNKGTTGSTQNSQAEGNDVMTDKQPATRSPEHPATPIESVSTTTTHPVRSCTRAGDDCVRQAEYPTKENGGKENGVEENSAEENGTEACNPPLPWLVYRLQQRQNQRSEKKSDTLPSMHDS